MNNNIILFYWNFYFVYLALYILLDLWRCFVDRFGDGDSPCTAGPWTREEAEDLNGAVHSGRGQWPGHMVRRGSSQCAEVARLCSLRISVRPRNTGKIFNHSSPTALICCDR